MRNTKKPFGLLGCLLSLLILLASCKEVPIENMQFPSEDCVMVYTISDSEYIRILYQRDSPFHLWGEWVKGEEVTPVQLQEHPIHSTWGVTGYYVILALWNPDEKVQLHTPDEQEFVFEKGVLNSSCLIDRKQNRLPIAFSTEQNLNFYFRWVSETLIQFNQTDNKVYREENLNFWYDFQSEKGEWGTGDTTISIRMKFSAVSPKNATLYIYDVSGETEKHILTVDGEIIDANTFTGTSISGTMFYEGTVEEIKL